MFWTLGMIWWTGNGISSIIGLSIGGAMAGVLWYYVIRWFMRWQRNGRCQATGQTDPLTIAAAVRSKADFAITLP